MSFFRMNRNNFGGPGRWIFSAIIRNLDLSNSLVYDQIHAEINLNFL